MPRWRSRAADTVEPAVGLLGDLPDPVANTAVRNARDPQEQRRLKLNHLEERVVRALDQGAKRERGLEQRHRHRRRSPEATRIRCRPKAGGSPAGAHQKGGAVRPMHECLRDAAEPQALESTPPVGGHHDEVDVLVAGIPGERVRRRRRRGRRGDGHLRLKATDRFGLTGQVTAESVVKGRSTGNRVNVRVWVGEVESGATTVMRCSAALSRCAMRTPMPSACCDSGEPSSGTMTFRSGDFMGRTPSPVEACERWADRNMRGGA